MCIIGFRALGAYSAFWVYIMADSMVSDQFGTFVLLQNRLRQAKTFPLRALQPPVVPFTKSALNTALNLTNNVNSNAAFCGPQFFQVEAANFKFLSNEVVPFSMTDSAHVLESYTGPFSMSNRVFDIQNS